MNTYEIVTNQFIAELEKGVIPWQKPWSGGTAMAVSYLTGKPYSYINQMLVGFRGGEYLTFNQVKKLGGFVNKGAKASTIVVYKQIHKIVKNAKGEDEDAFFPYFTTNKVFNLEDTTGIERKFSKEVKLQDNEKIVVAENAIQAYLAREKTLLCGRIDSDRAYYSPSTDTVVLPKLAQFKNSNEFYGTAFHELVHSTLIESRCNRPESRFGRFGDEVYSKEELVAEIGSAMALKELGIDTEDCFKNSVAYVQSWLKVLKNDNKMIFEAAKNASIAVHYILTGELPNKKNEKKKEKKVKRKRIGKVNIK